MNLKNDLHHIKRQEARMHSPEVYTQKDEKWTGLDLIAIIAGVSAIILTIVVLWEVFTGERIL